MGERVTELEQKVIVIYSKRKKNDLQFYFSKHSNLLGQK